IMPGFVFVENTPAITILGLDRVLRSLSELGYNAKWGVLGGAEAGMDCDGKRFWLLASAPGKRRSRILQSHNGEHAKAGCESRSSNHADSPTIVERIRRHEIRCGQPAILGELNGLANRVDRLGAIGSGQIPSVVALAWKTLT